ncbi:MAG: hypothetical protein ACYC4K_03510, partial [Thiobacillus sp.]
LRRMRGVKILIVGNHDPVFKDMVSDDPKRYEVARLKAMQLGFADAHRELSLDIAEVGRVKLSHFPYMPRSANGLEDYMLRYRNLRPARGKEALLLHGHVHSLWRTKVEPCTPLMLNIGVDVWDMKPVSEAQIVEKFKEIGGRYVD